MFTNRRAATAFRDLYKIQSCITLHTSRIVVDSSSASRIYAGAQLIKIQKKIFII